jgi:light-regulated signal transduction histidine kinase (bacteriophytochrome)
LSFVFLCILAKTFTPFADGRENVTCFSVDNLIHGLLNNAIKFSRLKEASVIEIGGHTKESENIYFVRDNGVGFKMHDADKLFIAFQRLHKEKEFEGTGIGLAIVQHIIYRRGGRVWAEGKLNEGATFYFTLPSYDSNPAVRIMRCNQQDKIFPELTNSHCNS